MGYNAAEKYDNELDFYMISSEQIIDMLKKSDALTNEDDLMPESLFSDHGIDSLDIFSLLLDVQEQIGVEIPDDDIDGLVSAETIIKYIEKLA